VRLFDQWLEDQLNLLAAASRLRSCPEMDGPSRARTSAFVSFCSNDYLGLSAHPALLAAAAATARAEGFGAGAARLVAGDLPAHRALEAQLAAFTSRSSALLFPTGYQTNVGVMGALAGPQDLIVSDAANHASIIDGCRLSRATVAVYPHGDAPAARALLAAPGTFRHRFVVTESLFSMDGDVAPLGDLAAAAQAADAIFIVDEAHALGVLGPQGRGLCAAAGVRPDVLVGTLGKAFGAAGGFAAGSRPLRTLLLNRARTFVYTTGLPPPVAAAAAAGVALAATDEGDARRARLASHCRRLTDRLLDLRLLAARPAGPILPIVLGDDRRALSVAAHLRSRGFFVAPIRPPTVAEGTARLRITLSADHTPAEVDALSAALTESIP
jgi:8-amino-7-oxononanoate synthase